MKFNKDTITLSNYISNIEYNLEKAKAIELAYPSSYFKKNLFYNDDNSIFDEIDVLWFDFSFIKRVDFTSNLNLHRASIYSNFNIRIVSNYRSRNIVIPDYDIKLLEQGFTRDIVSLVDQEIINGIVSSKIKGDIPDRLKRLMLFR